MPMIVQQNIINKINNVDDVEGRIHVEKPTNVKYKLNDDDGVVEGRIHAAEKLKK